MENEKSIEIILKETRRARGIPIEVAHEATKIPLDVLKAIEEGYTVRALASPFYRRQFIKMYASYLGVPVKDIPLAEPVKEERPVPLQFKRHAPPPKEAEVKPGFSLTKQQKQQIVLGIGALLIIFFVGKALGFVIHKVVEKKAAKKAVRVVKEKEKKPVAKPSKPKAAAAAEKPKAKKEEAKKEETKKEEAKKESAPELAPAPAVVDEPKKDIKSSEPEPRIMTPVRVSPENGKMVNLTVRAKKKSWLQVKVDGVTVFQSSLQKGAVENWQADDKIELTGNNILSLELEVNGKMIGAVGKGSSRARKLIVTKDGLSVKN